MLRWKGSYKPSTESKSFLWGSWIESLILYRGKRKKGMVDVEVEEPSVPVFKDGQKGWVAKGYKEIAKSQGIKEKNDWYKILLK